MTNGNHVTSEAAEHVDEPVSTSQTAVNDTDMPNVESEACDFPASNQEAEEMNQAAEAANENGAVLDDLEQPEISGSGEDGNGTFDALVTDEVNEIDRCDDGSVEPAAGADDDEEGIAANNADADQSMADESQSRDAGDAALDESECLDENPSEFENTTFDVDQDGVSYHITFFKCVKVFFMCVCKGNLIISALLKVVSFN